MEKLKAIVIDPVPDGRTKLRFATSQLHQFGRVKGYPSLENALRSLDKKEEKPLDVLFLIHSLGNDAISWFINRAKQTSRAQDSAYVLLLQSNSQDESVVASNLVDGADGFLLEPYSVDSLDEIVKLAISVRDQRRDARERVMITYLLNDAIKYIDEMSRALLLGLEPGPARKHFYRIRESLSALSGDTLTRYFDIAVDVLASIPAPSATGSDNSFASAEERLKTRLTNKGIQDPVKNIDTSKLKSKKIHAETIFYQHKPGHGTVALKDNLVSRQGGQALVEVVRDLVRDGKETISLDLSASKVINSYGLGRIADCYEVAKAEDCSLELKSPSDFVGELVEALRLNQLMPIES